jgi:hypothetical protein
MPALDLFAAGSAEDERRESTPVEQDETLLAAPQAVLKRGEQPA